MSEFYRILGGGVAGQVLYRELRDLEVACDLVERAAFPRAKVCGGVLQADTWEYLRERFDLSAQPITFSSMSQYWKRKRIAKLHLKTPMVYVPRIDLDAWLNDKNRNDFCPVAPAENSEVITIPANGPKKNDGEWVGFHSECDSDSKDTFEMRYGNGVYMGVSPMENDRCHVAFIVRRARFRNPDQIRDLILEEFGVELLGGLKGTARIHYGYQDERCAVGDAMMTTHPFLGFGMKHAVLSARLLAQCISKERMGDYPRLHREAFRTSHLVSRACEKILNTQNSMILKSVISNPWLINQMHRWTHHIKIEGQNPYFCDVSNK
jgi:flavin-dependent dehydrogenase